MSQAVATTSDNGLLNFIERASRDPEFDVAKFGELLRMQRDVLHEQAQREFNRAMADAQTEMMPVVRDASNTHTGSKYAKLETIDREMRPIYTRHGFSVRFGSAPSPREGWLRIVCTVSHAGGYSETNHLDAPPDMAGSGGRTNKTPIQAVGSSVTYLRRYLLAMVFNIVLADEDDDGEASRQMPRNAARKPPDGLDEPNGTLWLKNLDALLARAQGRQEVVDLRGDARVSRVLEGGATPTLIKARIEDMFRVAFERTGARSNAPPGDWQDPIGDLLAEVEAMDLIALNGLAASAEWRARVREAASFPPDQDRINEAIEARRAALQQGGGHA